MSSTLALNARVLNINASFDKGQGCFVEILEAMDNQLNAMLSYHSRVMVLRLEFHINDYSNDNCLMSKFVRKIKKRLVRKYRFKRIGHVWAREMEGAKKQHYHIALMLDANTVGYPCDVIKLCEEVWQGWNQPKPFTPENCFYIVNRGDDKAYGDAFYRLSYLAKERGKGHKAKAANDYSVSRIACKQQKENSDEQI